MVFFRSLVSGSLVGLRVCSTAQAMGRWLGDRVIELVVGITRLVADVVWLIGSRLLSGVTAYVEGVGAVQNVAQQVIMDTQSEELTEEERENNAQAATYLLSTLALAAAGRAVHNWE